MRSVASEWPLVLFTVLAPLCAGIWMVAGFLALIDAFPGAVDLTTGYAGAFLCVLLLAALACSTLHLGKPLKALRAFMRLGNSSVSNEVFVGAVFALCSCLYVLVAQSLIEAGSLWKIPLAFVAGFAGLFVLFQCLAYRMRTVSTWNSPSFSVEFAVLALLGGVVVEGAMLCLVPAVTAAVKMGLVVAEAACALGLLLVVHAQGAAVACGVQGHRQGSQMMRAWHRLSFARIAFLVTGSALWAYGLLCAPSRPGWALVGGALVIVGMVVGRYSFYRFYLNVGLPQG